MDTIAKLKRYKERPFRCGVAGLDKEGNPSRCSFTAPKGSGAFGAHFMLEHPDWWAANPARHEEYLAALEETS